MVNSCPFTVKVCPFVVTLCPYMVSPFVGVTPVCGHGSPVCGREKPDLPTARGDESEGPRLAQVPADLPRRAPALLGKLLVEHLCLGQALAVFGPHDAPPHGSLVLVVSPGPEPHHGQLGTVVEVAVRDGPHGVWGPACVGHQQLPAT